MTGLGFRRLSLSLWPFLILAGGEAIGAFLIVRDASAERGAFRTLIEVLIAVFAGVMVAAIMIWLSRRAVNASRAPAWRSLWASLAIYIVVGMVSGLVMVLVLLVLSPGGYPAQLVVLYTVTRPINVIVLAMVVQQTRSGIAASRELQDDVRGKLELARQTNAMIESAERELRAESRRLLSIEVAQPLNGILWNGYSLSDDALADELDSYMASHLRPMAHVLHPVSVRLGLIPAIRGLDDRLVVDASPTVSRMDSDGVLLDDSVRLQVYRWLRSSLVAPGVSRAALTVRGRELEVSVYPPVDVPVDAVQAAAGIRMIERGVVCVPLRGQVAETQVSIGVGSRGSGPDPRYRLRDLLTVPLPYRVFLVFLLAVGAAPFQYVLYRWQVSPQTLLSASMIGVCSVLVAFLLQRLPPPSPTMWGATRVLCEWVAIAVAAGLGLLIPATLFDLLPPGPAEWGLTFFRMSYRFLIPGLLVVLSFGLLALARRQLNLANDALKFEEERRAGLLEESQRVDRDVAEALHRTVQGRLAAAVIMLRIGRREQAWRQIVDMARTEIPILQGRLSDSPAGGDLVSDPPVGLSVVQVGEIDVADQDVEQLRSVVGEVAVNARRHGRASLFIVTVRREGNRVIIVCQDNGRGVQGIVRPGLGSRLLDETTARLAGHWTLEPLAGGCRVVIDVLVQPKSADLASSSA
ncbi:MAG: hypothetical protein RL347_19 [Actinomycetota bacterium]